MGLAPIFPDGVFVELYIPMKTQTKKEQSHGIDLCGVQVSFVEWNFNKMQWVFSL